MNRNEELKAYSDFYDDCVAYVIYAYDNHIPPEEVVMTLMHDIGGVSRQEKHFVPRVSGWAKAKDKFILKGDKP